MLDPICLHCGLRESEHSNGKCSDGSVFQRDDDFLDENRVIDYPEGEVA